MSLSALLGYKFVTEKSWLQAISFAILFQLVNQVLLHVLNIYIDIPQLVSTLNFSALFTTTFIIYLVLRYFLDYVSVFFFGEGKNARNIVLVTFVLDIIFSVIIVYYLTSLGWLLNYL